MKRQQGVIGAVLILAAVLSLIGVLHGLGPDREAIRAAAAAELEHAGTLDPVGRDRVLEAILANPDFQTHARAVWLKADKLHTTAHAAVKAEEAARKAVVPFLGRCKDLTLLYPNLLPALDDEARALQAEHGRTSYGRALAEVRRRIADQVAAAAQTCTESDHFLIVKETSKERVAGRYAAALKRIQEGIAKHPKCSLFLGKLGEETEALLKSSAAAAEKLLAAARTDRRPEPIEKALPDFEGLPDWSRLEAALRPLKRR